MLHRREREYPAEEAGPIAHEFQAYTRVVMGCLDPRTIVRYGQQQLIGVSSQGHGDALCCTVPYGVRNRFLGNPIQVFGGGFDGHV